MTLRPHLRLPSPTVERDGRWKSAPLALPRVSRPGHTTQRERFDGLFERLRSAMASDADMAALRADPTGLAPNRGLVFVTAEPVARIHEAIQNAGLNFVVEAAELFEPDNLFFYDGDTGRQIEGRLYVTMPSEEAFQTLIRLYEQYQRQEPFERGLTPLRHLFDLLRAVRPWSMRERVSDTTAQAILSRLQSLPAEAMRLEVEIYPNARAGARERILAAFGEGVRLVHEADLPEIRYHGLLLEVSPEAARAVAERVAGGPGEQDDIFLIEPQSVVQAEPMFGAGDAWTPPTIERPLPSLPPRAAVLDGIPVAEHPFLQSRIDILDPDDAAGRVVVNERRHGTAIASLIAHGDLAAGEPPLTSRLLVRPVLNRLSAPDLNGQRLEQFDADKLTVEVVHEALEGLFGADADARAAQVFVVNVSLGDRNRPHGAGPVSGWARLLDWWSATAGVLFIISTGNTGEDLPLSAFANYNAADSASEQEMTAAAMRALIDARATRPVLSPAEGINVLSVGATSGEAQSNQLLPSGVRDPLSLPGAPSLLSRCGPGIARAVKPDVLMPGGRTLASIRSTAAGPALRRSEATLLSGQRSAAPPVAVAAAAFPILRTHGTSNSAALATRHAVRSIENLTLEGGAFPDGLDREEAALLAKCLLVHAADWGAAGAFALERIAGQGSWEQQRRTISDLFGYGLVEADRALGSADHRVTLLDVGVIRRDQGLLYELRPPHSLSPSAVNRR